MSEPLKPSALRRRLRRWLFMAARTYLLLVIVFLFLENWLVFRPTSAKEGWAERPDPRIQDVYAELSDGTRLHGWWLPPTAPERGAILFCHDNGGNVSFQGFFLLDAQIQLDGLGVLAFDYPGYGKSEGSPNESRCVAAAEAFHALLTGPLGIAPNRVVLMGESLGGGVAADLAARREARALVLVKTFTSLPAVAKYLYPFLPTMTLMRTRFDTGSKLAGIQMPVFVAHGTADTLVPPAHADALYHAATEPKALHRMAGEDHNAPLAPAFYAALREFLGRHAP